MSGVFRKPYGGVFATGGHVAGPGLVSSDEINAIAVAAARLGSQERTPAVDAPPPASAAGVPTYWSQGGHTQQPKPIFEIRDGRVYPRPNFHPAIQQVLAFLKHTSATTPDATDTYTATEGDKAASALADVVRANALGHAYELLFEAEALAHRASAALSLIEPEDPARGAVNKLFVRLTTTKHELSGLVESLQNLGVR